MPELADFKAALDRGDNLVMVGNKPFILTGLHPERPANPVSIEAFTGARYKASLPDTKVVGRVDLALLRDGSSDAGPRQRASFFEVPLVLADGSKVQAGDRVKLATGEEAVYKGLNPRSPKNPVAIEVRGKSYRCPKAYIVALLPKAS